MVFGEIPQVVLKRQFFNCNVLDLGKRQLGRLAPKR